MAKHHPRHMSRRLVLQALYQFQLNAVSFEELWQQFSQTTLYEYSDVEYFKYLLSGILEQKTTLDELMVPFLNIPLEELDPVERSVLWLGAFELQHQLEIPYRVVINESLELTKSFGSVDGFKFINGVLDKLALTCRAIEVAADRGTRS